MSVALVNMKCVACRGGDPTLTDEEVTRLLPEVQGWSVAERGDGIKRIEKSFKFKNFAEALAFTDGIGRIAEEEGHHPAVLTEWGKVTVTWWTHKIRGLHKNDFIMAAKTDALAQDKSEPRPNA